MGTPFFLLGNGHRCLPLKFSNSEGHHERSKGRVVAEKTTQATAVRSLLFRVRHVVVGLDIQEGKCPGSSRSLGWLSIAHATIMQFVDSLHASCDFPAGPLCAEWLRCRNRRCYFTVTWCKAAAPENAPLERNSYFAPAADSYFARRRRSLSCATTFVGEAVSFHTFYT